MVSASLNSGAEPSGGSRDRTPGVYEWVKERSSLKPKTQDQAVSKYFAQLFPFLTLLSYVYMLFCFSLRRLVIKQ